MLSIYKNKSIEQIQKTSITYTNTLKVNKTISIMIQNPANKASAKSNTPKFLNQHFDSRNYLQCKNGPQARDGNSLEQIRNHGIQLARGAMGTWVVCIVQAQVSQKNVEEKSNVLLSLHSSNLLKIRIHNLQACSTLLKHQYDQLSVVLKMHLSLQTLSKSKAIRFFPQNIQ